MDIDPRTALYAYDDDPRGAQLFIHALNGAYCTLTVIGEDGTTVDVLVTSQGANRIASAVDQGLT